MKHIKFTSDEYLQSGAQQNANAWTGFRCLNCSTELYIESDEEPIRCECGKRYVMLTIMYKVEDD